MNRRGSRRGDSPLLGATGLQARVSEFTRLLPHARSVSLHATILIALSICALTFSSCGLRSQRLHPTVLPDGSNWTTVGGNLSSTGVVRQSSPLRVEARLWERKTGGVASSEPTVYNGLLYHSGRDRRVEVYDAISGERKLRDRYDGPVTGIVATDSSFVFVTDQSERKLYVYSNNPVKERWHLDIPISEAAPRVLPDGSIIVAALHGRLLRVSVDGEIMWDVQTQGDIQAPPAIVDSLCIVPTGRYVSTRRLSDGTELWAHLTDGAVMATPAVDGSVYAGSTDSLLYSLDLLTGQKNWTFATSGQLLTTPALGDSTLYLAANDRNVYAVSRRTGQKLWSYDTGGPANQSPALSGNILVVATATARLVTLNASTGTVLREFTLYAPAAAPPIIALSRVYVSDVNRRLHCFGPKE